jgi:hypothetical protein
MRQEVEERRRQEEEERRNYVDETTKKKFEQVEINIVHELHKNDVRTSLERTQECHLKGCKNVIRKNDIRNDVRTSLERMQERN